MLTGIDVDSFKFGEIGEGGTIFNTTYNIDLGQICNKLYYSIRVLQEKSFVFPVTTNLKLHTSKYCLEVKINFGTIEQETIYSLENKIIAQIKPGDWIVKLEDEILREDWFNIDSILDLDIPEKPWIGSIFLKGLDLPIKVFKESDIDYNNLKVPITDRLHELLVKLSLIIDDGIFDYTILSGGTKYAIYLLTEILNNSGTLIICDPWVKKLHPLTNDAVWRLIQRLKKQTIGFGIQLYNNSENIPIFTLNTLI